MNRLLPTPGPTSPRIERKKSGIARAVGSFSKPDVLGRLDGRSREARLKAAFKADLLQHIGGRPTIPQALMIEQAANLQLRISLMDARFAATNTMGDGEQRHYRAWVNTLANVLSKLGPAPAQPQEAPHLKVRRYLDGDRA
jgi:hypothetical protein